MQQLRSHAVWVAGTAVVAAVAGVGLAHSPSVPVDTQEAISGALTITWHGDPARGCADRGLCGVRGEIVVDPGGYGLLTHTSRSGDLDLSGDTAIVRVRRSDPSSAPAECVDTADSTDLSVGLRRRGRGWTAILDGQTPGAEHCAGPVVGELAHIRLPAHGDARGLRFDLRGRTRFSAGPFSGTVISTLRLRPPPQSDSSSSGGETSFAGPQRIRVHREFAALRYRITGPTGAIVWSFAGRSAPGCAATDSCGVTGAEWLSARPRVGTIVISASRTVRRPVGGRGALADLRAGRLDLTDSNIELPVRAYVQQRLSRQGGNACHDTLATPLSLMNDFYMSSPRPNRLRLALSDPYDSPDPLRTHCPGPSSSDLLGGDVPDDGAIARGSLPARMLGNRHISLTFSAPAGSPGGDYQRTPSGGWSWTLTLVRARGGTRSEVIYR